MYRRSGGSTECNGEIAASYAVKNTQSGEAGDDYVGGLVGWQDSSASVIASYATGNVDGGTEDDSVGIFMGSEISVDTHEGVIEQSYDFGTPSNGEEQMLPSAGTSYPSDVSSASDLTSAGATGAGSSWNDLDKNTLDAWDFGSTSETPALKYADYDGSTAGLYYCAANALLVGNRFQIPIPCNTMSLLIPGQRE